MLALTDAAAEAISALTAQEGQTDSGGLRFAVQAQQDSGAQLALSVAPAPEEGDQVVGADGGAKVFLEPQAAIFLDDKVLDVQQDEQGQLNFAVLPQPDAQQPGL
ncbi:HesB/IscA family protein [Amycolatopsis tucumanensis]|uniref:Iron-sulfur cluster biosynthesis family protein n=1 Tax=Amycolatopsis tucumanensis TaxID=401106 RepID=A0ABP7ICC0_9PSEU|nr:iron-sulfur cluster biosynthesis family protein [Amycolatopsis tucumanensis]MCF6422647.1 iron-sulfur cluster biosynthesis protein [Amycolatopsis tucumanensis]